MEGDYNSHQAHRGCADGQCSDNNRYACCGNNEDGLMIDPLSALAIVKTGITAGKQLHSMSKEIAGFFDSVDDAKKAHMAKKNRLFASANEEAMATWTQMQNARQAEEELREFITNRFGFSSYQELLKLRREITIVIKETAPVDKVWINRTTIPEIFLEEKEFSTNKHNEKIKTAANILTRS